MAAKSATQKKKNPIRRVLDDTYNSFMYPFPGCPYCNQRERVLVVARILFLVGLLMLGNKLIDYVSHDIESTCCQAVANYNKQFDAQIESKNIAFDTYKNLSNGPIGLT